jgi:hypothetical protein
MLAKLLARRRLMIGLITFVFAVLAVVAVLELSLVVRHGISVLPLLARRLPLALYLFALWSLRRAMAAIGRSAAEEEIVARRLGDVGLALLLGGLAQVFAVPILLHFLQGNQVLVFYDVAAVTLGAVGFGLLLVALLFEQALRARRELGEFV